MTRRPISQGDCSVYIARDEQGRVVYVGITSQGANRNGQHWKNSEWWRHHVSQTKEDYPTRRQALAREAELIRLHRPPFNKAQNPGWEHLHRAYLEMVEPHRYGHPAALEIAATLNWWVPLHPVSVRGYVARFEADQGHLEITSRCLPSLKKATTESGEVVGHLLSAHGPGSGKTHAIQLDSLPEVWPSCARLRVEPVPGFQRFRVMSVEVSFRRPAPWLPAEGAAALHCAATGGGA